MRTLTNYESTSLIVSLLFVKDLIYTYLIFNYLYFYWNSRQVVDFSKVKEDK